MVIRCIQPHNRIHVTGFTSRQDSRRELTGEGGKRKIACETSRDWAGGSVRPDRTLIMQKKLKAIAINGSPRPGGNTETLLKKVLEPLAAARWETEFIQLGGEPIRGCRACYACFKTKNDRCGQKEDCFNPCMEKMIEADAIILGSPTYFSDVSAEMKALLDRAGLVALANGGLFRKKIGAAVVAVRRGGGTHAFDTINHMFLMSGAIVPGSTYWNLGFGLDKGAVAQDDEALRNMADLGQTIAWRGSATSVVPSTRNA